MWVELVLVGDSIDGDDTVMAAEVEAVPRVGDTVVYSKEHYGVRQVEWYVPTPSPTEPCATLWLAPEPY